MPYPCIHEQSPFGAAEATSSSITSGTIRKLSPRATVFSLAYIVSPFVFALHAYSRSARAPLPRLLLTARAWPSPPASTPDLKPPRRRVQSPRSRPLPDRTPLYRHARAFTALYANRETYWILPTTRSDASDRQLGFTCYCACACACACVQGRKVLRRRRGLLRRRGCVGDDDVVVRALQQHLAGEVEDLALLGGLRRAREHERPDIGSVCHKLSSNTKIV
eukprot:4903744-Pleurochrysis_carterae.AAC.2